MAPCLGPVSRVRNSATSEGVCLGRRSVRWLIYPPESRESSGQPEGSTEEAGPCVTLCCPRAHVKALPPQRLQLPQQPGPHTRPGPRDGRPQGDETFRAKSKKGHECYAVTQPEFMERCFSSGPGTSQIPTHSNIPDKEET